jgi:hypothetical protein
VLSSARKRQLKAETQMGIGFMHTMFLKSNARAEKPYCPLLQDMPDFGSCVLYESNKKLIPGIKYQN